MTLEKTKNNIIKLIAKKQKRKSKKDIKFLISVCISFLLDDTVSSITTEKQKAIVRKYLHDLIMIDR
tara:strand:+ start:294 stop:494 length:201 start_codon:yes stop_codon:yes gene_type:complete